VPKIARGKFKLTEPWAFSWRISKGCEIHSNFQENSHNAKVRPAHHIPHSLRILCAIGHFSEVICSQSQTSCASIQSALGMTDEAQMLARVTGRTTGEPGPGAYQIPSTVGNAPRWTLKGRHPDHEGGSGAPYRTLPSTVGDGPKISLASRHGSRDATQTPGPAYIPPPLGTDAKKSSLSYRHTHGQDSGIDSPGPGAYAIKPKFGNEANKFTFHQRTGGTRDDTVSPGPAAYHPNLDAMYPHALPSTMHIRTKSGSSDVTPGPSDYAVSRALGGPSSTFHVRPQESNSQNTPGPGQYCPSNRGMGEAPKWSFKSRHDTENHPTNAPYRALPSTVGAGPKISMASRHAQRTATDTPGPAYIPPPLGADAKKSSMSYRHTHGQNSGIDSPGPGAYPIKPKFGNEANKFTFHQRTGGTRDDTVSPGPAAYSPNIDAMRPRGPASAMHVRTPMKGAEQTPGYLALGSSFGKGGVTIGRKEYLDVIAV
jgi:hypothetical protein